MENMKPEIGFMNQLSTNDILDDVWFAVKNNFDWFEIGLDWQQNYSLSPQIIKEIKQISKKHNLRLIVHTAFYLPVSTLLPDLRRGVIENAEKAIILAKKVGADRLTIHSGYREMPKPAIGLCYQSLIDNLVEIVKIGKKYGVYICLENSDKLPNLLCVEMKDFLNVLNSVRGLKVTLDVGHSNTASTKPAQYFKNVRNFIMNMHIHDNMGETDEHKCLGRGNIDFKKLFSECKRTGYKGPFILELFPYKDILKGKEVLSNIWEKK